jgi:hypothetical protein
MRVWIAGAYSMSSQQDTPALPDCPAQQHRPALSQAMQEPAGRVLLGVSTARGSVLTCLSGARYSVGVLLKLCGQGPQRLSSRFITRGVTASAIASSPPSPQSPAFTSAAPAAPPSASASSPGRHRRCSSRRRPSRPKGARPQGAGRVTWLLGVMIEAGSRIITAQLVSRRATSEKSRSRVLAPVPRRDAKRLRPRRIPHPTPTAHNLQGSKL